MISMAYFFNVIFINTDLYLNGETRNIDGTVTRSRSNVEISTPRTSKLIPRNITVTKVVT